MLYGPFKRGVLNLKTKPENKSEHEVRSFTPSDWSNREGRPSRLAGLDLDFMFCLIVLALKTKLKTKT